MTLHPHNINKQIAEIVRIERIKKGYSQQYMASQLQISQNVYSRIERGQSRLEVERLHSIAVILEIDMGELWSSL